MIYDGHSPRSRLAACLRRWEFSVPRCRGHDWGHPRHARLCDWHTGSRITAAAAADAQRAPTHAHDTVRRRRPLAHCRHSRSHTRDQCSSRRRPLGTKSRSWSSMLQSAWDAYRGDGAWATAFSAHAIRAPGARRRKAQGVTEPNCVGMRVNLELHLDRTRRRARNGVRRLAH